CLSKPNGRFFLFFTLSVVGLYVNPWSGQLLMSIITPGAYWRFLYLLPVPLCVGFLVTRFNWNTSIRENFATLGFLTVLVLLVVQAYDRSVFSGVQIKAPSAYRFPPSDYVVARSVVAIAARRHLLAPEAIIHIVPLLDPGITVEAARSFQTVFDFSKIGQSDEGKRRVLAQNLVTTCVRTTQADAALLASIQQGVTAIVIGPCESTALRNLLKFIYQNGIWSMWDCSYGYSLLLWAQRF
ncbi:MAG: hypothetical protein ACRERV_17080, partial [Methylococcales bacterium]